MLRFVDISSSFPTSLLASILRIFLASITTNQLFAHRRWTMRACPCRFSSARATHRGQGRALCDCRILLGHFTLPFLFLVELLLIMYYFRNLLFPITRGVSIGGNIVSS